jgi:hypothetical protein
VAEHTLLTVAAPVTILSKRHARYSGLYALSRDLNLYLMNNQANRLFLIPIIKKLVENAAGQIISAILRNFECKGNGFYGNNMPRNSPAADSCKNH